MATECPECESVFNGKSCACGYTPPAPARESYKPKEYGKPTPPPDEFKQAAKSFKFSAESRAWADRIIDRYKAGEYKYEHIYLEACAIAHQNPELNHEEAF